MVSQTLNKHFFLSHFISFRFSPTLGTGQVACAAPGDYGFDFDETELENELPVQQLNRLSSQYIQPIEASEFETRYRWFIS